MTRVYCDLCGREITSDSSELTFARISDNPSQNGRAVYPTKEICPHCLIKVKEFLTKEMVNG